MLKPLSLADLPTRDRATSAQLLDRLPAKEALLIVRERSDYGDHAENSMRHASFNAPRSASDYQNPYQRLKKKQSSQRHLHIVDSFPQYIIQLPPWRLVVAHGVTTAVIHPAIMLFEV